MDDRELELHEAQLALLRAKKEQMDRVGNTEEGPATLTVEDEELLELLDAGVAKEAKDLPYRDLQDLHTVEGVITIEEQK